MECNKDEAFRAKEIALKKMQSNDFDGAQKMAMKAQVLFPDLENITQLLSVCRVHCSAQSRILGTEKDWYGILQLERKVDEVTIKKQYRKLALLLHPDKNHFPGAEAAFKLIGEAHLALSDSKRKADYDRKIEASFNSSQLKYPPVNPPTQGKNGVHKSMADGYFNQFNVQKHAAQSNANSLQRRFWTCCAFCKINYQFPRNFVNVKLTCQDCKKAFVAIDMGAQPGSNQTHTVPQAVPRAVPQAVPRAVPQAVPVPPRPAYQSQTAFQGMSSGFDNRQQASNLGESNNMNNHKQDVSHGFPSATKANQSSVSQANYKTAEKTTGFQPPHSGRPSNLGKASSRDAQPNKDSVHQKKQVEDRGKNKRKRKGVVDASQKSGSHGFHEPWRSSRQKQDVTYVEPQEGDDDFDCPQQRSPRGKSFCASEVRSADSLNKGSNASKGRAPADNSPYSKSEIGGKPTDELNGGAQGVETIHDSDSDSDFESSSDGGASSGIYNCPDPEFHDFDKFREETCFGIGQFWACYGDPDGMPRYYAQVKKVFSDPFKAQISWLEFDPDSDSPASDWNESGLPAGCGNFERGSRNIVGHLTFSHRIECDQGKKKGTFMIYPRRGEIWALFRGWNTGWVNDDARPKKFTYDIVEVLSNFSEHDGIHVALLEKVKGYVSLFHRNNSDRTISIPPNEMLRFSHMTPSFKMKGDEKYGVPAGSFELDTASVNLEPDADTEEPLNSETPKTTSKKTTELSENDSLKHRVLGKTGGNASQINSSLSIRKEVSGTNSRISRSDFSPAKPEFIFEEINSQSPRKSRRVNLASSPKSHVPQNLFCDFTSGRSIDKFQVGHLWALYNSESKLPNIYGRIKKIHVSPFKLHVALSENESSACGTFKLQTETQELEPTLFSHVLDVKISKGTFEIYPKKGQVWALNKNHNVQLSSSESRSSGYDIVEIVGKSKGFFKLLILVKLKDYKSVFSSSDRRLEIPLKDLTGFSHQIPAVKLRNEGGHNWPAGCWELDPASVPLNV